MINRKRNGTVEVVFRPAANIPPEIPYDFTLVASWDKEDLSKFPDRIGVTKTHFYLKTSWEPKKKTEIREYAPKKR